MISRGIVMAHQRRGEDTRAHILAAAADCFTRAGYDATGVAEICARAGVSKGAFYHHFPGKQAAFMALFEQWLAGWMCRFRPPQGGRKRARASVRSRRHGAARVRVGRRADPDVHRVLAAGGQRSEGVAGDDRALPALPGGVHRADRRGDRRGLVATRGPRYDSAGDSLVGCWIAVAGCARSGRRRLGADRRRRIAMLLEGLGAQPA